MLWSENFANFVKNLIRVNMKDKLREVQQHWANNNLAGDILQGGDILPKDSILLKSKDGEDLLSMRDLMLISKTLPESNEPRSDEGQPVEFEVSRNQPDLGAKCVVWFNGEPRMDKLTDEGHYESYWEDAGENFGEEDRFMILPD